METIMQQSVGNMNTIVRRSRSSLWGALLCGTLMASQGMLSAAEPSLPAPGTYQIDPPHTFALFEAQHKIVGRVLGRFNKSTGTVVVANEPSACSVDVAIDATTLDTQNSMRDEDLRGPDFFNTAKFPVITYRGKGIRRSGDAWVIDGALTIHGVTKTVPLTFQFGGTAPAQPGKPKRVAFHATAAVKRADFGMTRGLLGEIGKLSERPDVWIRIDTELLEASR